MVILIQDLLTFFKKKKYIFNKIKKKHFKNTKIIKYKIYKNDK